MTTATRKRQRCSKQALDDAAITVTDNWGQIVPITTREVETVEIYLGRVLDELLRTLGVHHVLGSSVDSSAVIHPDSTAA